MELKSMKEIAELTHVGVEAAKTHIRSDKNPKGIYVYSGQVRHSSREKLYYWPPDRVEEAAETVKVEAPVERKSWTYSELASLDGDFNEEQARAWSVIVKGRADGAAATLRESEANDKLAVMKAEVAKAVDAERKAWEAEKARQEAALVEREKAVKKAEAVVNKAQEELEKQKEAIKDWADTYACLLRDCQRVKDYYNEVVKAYPNTKKVLEPEFELNPDFYNKIDDGRDGASDAVEATGGTEKTRRSRAKVTEEV